MLCASPMMARSIVTGILGTVVGGMVWAATPAMLDRIETLPLSAVAVPLDAQDPARQDVGRLRYCGGLVLRSANPAFGGLSGLRAGPGGRLLAISDTGNWVTFTTVERGGRLVGVNAGTIAPLLDQNGAPPSSKTAADAESVEWDPATGDAIVSFEQDHRRQVYRGIDPADSASFGHPAVAVLRDPATAAWPANGGGEAIARLADGSLAIFEEEGQDAQGFASVLTIGPQGTVQSRYAPPRGFRPTDTFALDAHTLLVLNRHFSPLDGLAAALTLVIIGPDMPSREIARLAPPLAVDNMEGLALVRDGARTYVYLVSDDNFSQLQRTLLLKFELLRQ